MRVVQTSKGQICIPDGDIGNGPGRGCRLGTRKSVGAEAVGVAQNRGETPLDHSLYMHQAQVEFVSRKMEISHLFCQKVVFNLALRSRYHMQKLNFNNHRMLAMFVSVVSLTLSYFPWRSSNKHHTPSPPSRSYPFQFESRFIPSRILLCSLPIQKIIERSGIRTL